MLLHEVLGKGLGAFHLCSLGRRAEARNTHYSTKKKEISQRIGKCISTVMHTLFENSLDAFDNGLFRTGHDKVDLWVGWVCAAVKCYPVEGRGSFTLFWTANSANLSKSETPIWTLVTLLPLAVPPLPVWYVPVSLWSAAPNALPLTRSNIDVLDFVRLSKSPSNSMLATASTDEENRELFYKSNMSIHPTHISMPLERLLLLPEAMF